MCNMTKNWHLVWVLWNAFFTIFEVIMMSKNGLNVFGVFALFIFIGAMYFHGFKYAEKVNEEIENEDLQRQ